MRLLVIKPSALGDVAQALMVVPRLRADGICSHLAWVCDEAYTPLLASCPQVDEIIPYPRMRWRRNRPLREILGWARALRDRPDDVVLDLQGLARSALMTLAGNPKARRIGLRSAREAAWLAYQECVSDDAVHAVDRYAQAMALLGGFCPLPEPWLDSSRLGDQNAFNFVNRQPYTVLHPYSQRPEKLWPFRRYQEMVDANPEHDFVLVGQGPWFPCSGPRVTDLRNRTTLSDLLKVIASARCLVSTDSGPLHIASAFGIPAVGIFGASLPARTRPRGARSTCLWDASFDHQQASALHSASTAALAMGAISTANVITAWRKLVGS